MPAIFLPTPHEKLALFRVSAEFIVWDIALFSPSSDLFSSLDHLPGTPPRLLLHRQPALFVSEFLELHCTRGVKMPTVAFQKGEGPRVLGDSEETLISHLRWVERGALGIEGNGECGGQVTEAPYAEQRALSFNPQVTGNFL